MSENPQPSFEPTQQLPQTPQTPQTRALQDSQPPQPYQQTQAYEQAQAYQPQPYQGYSAPPYAPAYGQSSVRDHPLGTVAFVLGLLSVLGLTFLGPFGWYYGRKVIREVDSNPGAYSNRGLGMAGMVLGIIGTIFLVLTVALLAGGIIFAIVGAASSTS